MPNVPAEREVIKPDQVKGSSSGTADEECSICGAKRGEAPEGLHDHVSAFKHGAEAGDPRWTSDKCWHCGATY